ncbi:hypothetical protein C8T65DRAFT_737479 [Cerioporus squamosus]|nr:hypothetical protein C8T65DRAFT_737479 [Cerioporus squamosus]
MMIGIRYVLVLALFGLAANVRAAPVDPTSSVPNTASHVTKDDGMHVGAAANYKEAMDKVLKKVPHQPRGLPGPVRVGEGNADKSSSAVPVQNYQNDAAKLPLLDSMPRPEGQGGEE